MTDDKQAPGGRPSLRDFDPYTDRNGALHGEEDAFDVGDAVRMRTDRTSNPMGQAETARLASDQPRRDAIGGGSIETSEQTAAETPPENLAHISDPTPRPAPNTPAAAREAIDRATAAVGHEDER